MNFPGRFLTGFVCGLTLLQSSLSASDISSDSQVKAAMIYNMAKFVDWPATSFPSDMSPLIICVIGKGSFGSALESLKGKTIKSRSIVVRQLSQSDGADSCHILVINESARRHLSRILEQASDMNILTVSDLPKFALSGGMVGFMELEGKIRFEINLETTRQSKVKISSQLLKLANIIRTAE